MYESTYVHSCGVVEGAESEADIAEATNDADNQSEADIAEATNDADNQSKA